MTLATIGDPTYIGLETFKKNGDAVNTPLWVVAEDGKLLAWTDGGSWKVKRIRNNSYVRVCIGDRNGAPQGEWLDAQAKIIDDATSEQKVRKQIAAKYSWQYWMIKVFTAFSQRGRKSVVIEIREKS